VLKELETSAVENRPEVSNATLKVKAALSGISVRRAAFAPQVSLFAMGDAMQQHGMPGFAGTAFGLTASIALTNGGMRRAAVKDAEGALAGALAMQQKAVQQVTRQVKDAYVQLKSAEAELVAAKAAVVSSTEAYQEELQRFGAGRSTDADVLEALAARTTAEYGAAAARFDLQSAYYRLMYAAGRPIVSG
jgi:outer membrane protein TolC